MAPLAALWLPIILSAVIVFIASSIMHMLLPYHRRDYHKVDEETNPPCASRRWPHARTLRFSLRHAERNEVACDDREIQTGTGTA